MADVTNPLHTFLTRLLTRVHQVQDDLGKKMDKPAGNMASGKVWTSTTAKEWGGRLNDQCRAYNTGLSGLSEELSAMLSRTPKTCSEAEAKQWRIELGE